MIFRQRYSLYLIVALAACDNASPGYHTFTLRKGIGHFSFEYPSRYNIDNVEIRDDYQYTNITITGPWLDEVQDETLLSVFVMTPDEYNSNAETVLEDSLARASGTSDFELLGRSSVMVAGILGEQYVYFCNRYSESLYAHEGEPAPTVFREIYFDYGGLIWNITLRSYTSTMEADEVHFDHLLETFKILN